VIVLVGILIGTGTDAHPDVILPAVQAHLRTFAVLGPSIVLTGLTMAGVGALTVVLARVPLEKGLALRRAPWPAFVVAPLGILALGPTSDFLRRLMQAHLPGWTFGTIEGLDAVARSAPIWLIVPAMALVPGFAEELLFRGMFQSVFRRRALAVILSGVLFAAYHTDPHHVAAVLPLGLYLAWLRDRTGTVLVPIFAHVMNNATAVIAAVAVGTADTSEALDWYWMPIGWAVAGLAMGTVWWSTRPPVPEGAPGAE
jgi:hypothetical protein